MTKTLLLSLEDVSLSFGGKPLFEDAKINIHERDRICLIGKNGAGKTTLMNLLTGAIEPDSGKRYLLPGIEAGYLRQDDDTGSGESVLQYVMSGLKKEQQNNEHQYLAEMIIEPLGLKPEVITDSLSGGQKRRASLAKALVTEPDILMLDEPTNHLDLEAIEWLEEYLKSYRGALVLVSHDRTFLSNITGKIFWIDRGTIRTHSKGYKYFNEWADNILEQEARTLKNTAKKLEAEESWTQGGVTARRKRNVRRMGELRRLREKLKSDKAAYNQTMRTIKLDPLEPAQASKVAVEFKEVTKKFVSPDKLAEVKILDNFHLRVLKGDRIGILGKNGSGKSSFLKLLIGEIDPDKGSIKLGKNIEISYFDQHRSDLNPKKTVWETLCPDGGDYVMLGSKEKPKPIHVCGYLKNFLFDPRVAKEYAGTLSGGQQNRLLLAKILANPGSIMILDEPTNDLDMDTMDMLQEIIADYQGTLFIVSHDRDFLDRTVTKILAFEGNAVVEGHMGGYSDYLEKKQKERPSTSKLEQSNNNKVQKSETINKPKKSSDKMSFKLKHELETLPGIMEELAQQIESLNVTLKDPDLYINDPDKFDKSTKEIAAKQEKLEKSEARWLELEILQEEMES